MVRNGGGEGRKALKMGKERNAGETRGIRNTLSRGEEKEEGRRFASPLPRSAAVSGGGVCGLSPCTAPWLSLRMAGGSCLRTLLGPWMGVLLLWG